MKDAGKHNPKCGRMRVRRWGEYQSEGSFTSWFVPVKITVPKRGARNRFGAFEPPVEKSGDESNIPYSWSSLARTDLATLL